MIEVQDDVIRFDNRKAVALLAFLTISRQAQSREKIAALLWPEIGQSLAALRTTLWELRRKLGDQYFITSHQDIALAVDNDFSSDIVDFTTLIQASSKSTLELTQRIELLQQAINLYQDDFMAGFSLRDSAEYDDWQRTYSAYFQRLQQRALVDLAALHERNGDDYSAIQTAERLRFMDRLAQEPVEILMRLYLKSGQRQSCHRLYEEYTTDLQHELGVDPGEVINSLYQSMLNPSPIVATTSASSARPVTGPLAAGHISATIYRTPETVIGRPRKFFGRETLVSRVVQMLEDGEQVMLTGMGGIGKTATAATIAAEFIKFTGQPVIWLETGYQTADEILLALARVFDQQQNVLANTNSAAFVMQLVVAQKALLVLDNCWNAPALFEVLQAAPTNLPVLFTSRQRIPIDGEIVAVDALSKTDAQQLLTYHARRDFAHDPDVDALLHLLGNHPYALAIAGKQLKAQPGISTKDLQARYLKGTHEIAIVGGYGEQGRQSIEHIIASSVESVSDEACTLLNQMGSLATPRASLELLSLMLDISLESLQRIIAELEQVSLIDVHPSDIVNGHLYQMHDLTFNYCRDMFKKSHLDRSSLVRGAVKYMQIHSHNKMTVQLEFTNLMGAIRAAIQLKDADAVIFIMRTIMTDGYFDAFGYTPELLDHLHEAIQLAQNAGDAQRESLHYLLCKHANVLLMQGKLEVSLQEHLEAIAIAPNPQRRALIASTLAMIAVRLNREEYGVYLNEAETVARVYDIHDVLSRVLETRGHIALEQNDLEQARKYFEEAVRYASKLDLPDGYFYALYNLGFVEIESANYEHAELILDRAYQLALRENNDLWKGMYFSSIARCTHIRGDREKTYSLMNKALHIYEQVGNVNYADWVRSFLTAEGYITKGS